MLVLLVERISSFNSLNVNFIYCSKA